MIELQIISRILKQQNLSLLTLNGITDEYFLTYKDEYDFIINHYNAYGNIPDKETFINTFPDFTLLDVNESDQYLINTFNEEHLYALTVPVVTKLAEILQTDSRAAVEYLQSQLPNLTQKSPVQGIDIISGAKDRLDLWIEKKKNKEQFFIPTGFAELDSILGGYQRGEELVVIFARTGQGKSWILIKSLECAWKHNYRVGLLEPEMSANTTGYRFDTLMANIPNSSLNQGEDIRGYQQYIKNLQSHGTPFFVTHPKDFSRRVTVSKLRSWIESNNLDILGIDGISYLQDERKQRGDSRTISLTNISEDLMELSISLGIPIIVVTQSNRDGGGKDNPDAPDIENIRDSDGIGYNASKIIAAKQKGPGIEIVTRKNRYGKAGDKLLYFWDINTGVFNYIPTSENQDDEQIETVRNNYRDATEVF